MYLNLFTESCINFYIYTYICVYLIIYLCINYSSILSVHMDVSNPKKFAFFPTKTQRSVLLKPVHLAIFRSTWRRCHPRTDGDVVENPGDRCCPLSVGLLRPLPNGHSWLMNGGGYELLTIPGSPSSKQLPPSQTIHSGKFTARKHQKKEVDGLDDVFLN